MYLHFRKSGPVYGRSMKVVPQERVLSFVGQDFFVVFSARFLRLRILPMLAGAVSANPLAFFFFRLTAEHTYLFVERMIKMAEKSEMTRKKTSIFRIAISFWWLCCWRPGPSSSSLRQHCEFLRHEAQFHHCHVLPGISADTAAKTITAAGQAAVIGLLAGAICQFLPGTPWLNFISDRWAPSHGSSGRIPMKIGKVNFTAAAAAFLSTLLSGSAFVACLFLFLDAAAQSLAAYVPIVLCTAPSTPSSCSFSTFRSKRRCVNKTQEPA
jgi:hypothetical protein